MLSLDFLLLVREKCWNLPSMDKVLWVYSFVRLWNRIRTEKSIKCIVCIFFFHIHFNVFYFNILIVFFFFFNKYVNNFSLNYLHTNNPFYVVRFPKWAFVCFELVRNDGVFSTFFLKWIHQNSKEFDCFDIFYAFSFSTAMIYTFSSIYK